MNYHNIMIFFTIGILIFLVDIEYSAVNLALKTIAEETYTPLNLVQWVLSVYVLVWGAMVIPAGRLGNIYSQRTILFLGLFIFLGGSTVAGMSPHLEMLIGGRIIQGLGAALFFPPCYNITFNSVAESHRGTAIGMLTAISSFGLAIGPTLSGYILEYLNWRWIFWLNLPLGLLAYVMGYFHIPRDAPLTPHEKIDWIAASSLAGGLGLFMYGLNQMESSSIFSLNFGFTILLACVALLFFWKRNESHKNQTIPSLLFKNKTFMGIILACFLASMIFADILIMMGIYLQTILHYSSVDTGITFLAMSLPMGIVCLISGKLIDHFSGYYQLIAGSFFLFVSALLLVFVSQDTTFSYLIVALILNGSGCGFVYTCLNTILLKSLNPEEINSGTAVFTMANMIGNTFSVILNIGLCLTIGQKELNDLIAFFDFSLNEAQKNILKDLIAHIDHSVAQIHDISVSVALQLTAALDQAFLKGISVNMIVALMCAVGITFITINRLKVSS